MSDVPTYDNPIRSDAARYSDADNTYCNGSAQWYDGPDDAPVVPQMRGGGVNRMNAIHDSGHSTFKPHRRRDRENQNVIFIT